MVVINIELMRITLLIHPQSPLQMARSRVQMLMHLFPITLSLQTMPCSMADILPCQSRKKTQVDFMELRELGVVVMCTSNSAIEPACTIAGNHWAECKILTAKSLIHWRLFCDDVKGHGMQTIHCLTCQQNSCFLYFLSSTENDKLVTTSYLRATGRKVSAESNKNHQGWALNESRCVWNQDAKRWKKQQEQDVMLMM